MILSDRLWRTRFGADPDIIGRKVTLNQQPFTVIGVMAPGTVHPGNEYHSLPYGEDVDVWWPFSFAGDPNHRGSHFIEVIARLKDGVSISQAKGDMNTIMQQLAREHPNNDAGWSVLVIPLYNEVVGPSRQMLLVLLGAVDDCSADCVRQCGQPAAGPGIVAAARDCRAPGDGRSARRASFAN